MRHTLRAGHLRTGIKRVSSQDPGFPSEPRIFGACLCLLNVRFADIPRWPANCGSKATARLQQSASCRRFYETAPATRVEALVLRGARRRTGASEPPPTLSEPCFGVCWRVWRGAAPAVAHSSPYQPSSGPRTQPSLPLAKVPGQEEEAGR